jgi:aspartate carbamoyltransferase
MMAVLPESQARLYAADQALELGEGGIAIVSQVTGLSPEVIEDAIRELQSSAPKLPRPPVTSKAKSIESKGHGPHDYMDWFEYERRLGRPLQAKLPEFMRNDRIRHVIYSQQFDRDFLDRICQVTSKMKEIGETREGMLFLSELLRHKRAMLYFTQASTRTFLSFLAACQILGMGWGEIRDPSVSSEAKGESPLDSICMFSSYFDVIIMRAKYPDFAEACAYKMNDLDRMSDADRHGLRGVPIINGGSGADEHPTQALLDIYTIQRIFSFESKKDSSRRTRFDSMRRKYKDLTRGLDGKVYCFCGDIGRGRTVRSLAKMLALCKDVTMYFVYPKGHEKLALSPDLRDFLLERNIRILEGHRLADVVDQVDVLYMTRIQREHDRGDTYDVDALSACKLNIDLVARMKEYAAILHPFPRNGKDPEIPFEIDDDPRAMYFDQSHNGMWVRAALLAYLFNVDGRVYVEHERLFSRRHGFNEGAVP